MSLRSSIISFATKCPETLARLCAVEYSPYAWTDLSKTSNKNEPAPRAKAKPVRGSICRLRLMILIENVGAPGTLDDCKYL